MAECLVPDSITPDLIDVIYVASDEVRDKLQNSLGGLANIADYARPREVL